MTTCILICAGEATRWKNYLGIPKHLIKIDGETLIERTTRLILKNRSLADLNINIVVKDIMDMRYAGRWGVTMHKAVLNPKNYDADKFLSSEHLWNKHGRTIVFYGDVWFSEEAMETIMNYKSHDWTLFASSVECFAQSFYPEDHNQHRAMLHYIREQQVAGKITQCGGWQHYRAMCNSDLNVHKYGDKFVMIDDLTDDFDYPAEYDAWIKKYEQWKCDNRRK